MGTSAPPGTVQRAIDRAPAWLDLVQGASGALLVAFMWVHMGLVSSILISKDAMYHVARFFEGVYFLGRPHTELVVGIAAAIFLLVVVHVVVAIRRIPASYREYRILFRHSRDFRHADTWLWLIQVGTGLLLMFDTQTASSPNSSNGIRSAAGTLGDPNCPHCHGVGYVRQDVPLGDERFGRLESCVCRAKDAAESARARLFALSTLDRLSHLGFENFNSAGNEKAKFMTPQEKEGLHQALEACEEFARSQSGWLLLEGEYGCGKTHLAAAIANDAVSRGVPTLLITVPELLDSLRFAFADTETTFEQRFEEIRNAALLILDDFGTQNATAWAQEKLFQIINYRYINKMPTVITTNPF